MFSPLARPALTSETRGQTCWTFFGNHLRHADGALIKKGEAAWTPLPERPFPEQKAGLLPEAVSGVRLARDPHIDRMRAERLPDWGADSCLSLTLPDGVHADLHGAYRNTTYRAYGPSQGPIDIRIGTACPVLDAPAPRPTHGRSSRRGTRARRCSPLRRTDAGSTDSNHDSADSARR